MDAPRVGNAAAVAELAGFAFSCFVEFAHDGKPLAPMIVFEGGAGVSLRRFAETAEGRLAAREWMRNNPEGAARAVLCECVNARGESAFVASCMDFQASAAFRMTLRYRPAEAPGGFAVDSHLQLDRDHVGLFDPDFRQQAQSVIPRGALGRRRGFDLWEQYRRDLGLGK